MHDIMAFFNKLHYDPLKRVYWISDVEVISNCPSMDEFFKDIRRRGTDEFERQLDAYMNDKKNVIAGKTEAVEVSDFELDMLKVYAEE